MTVENQTRWKRELAVAGVTAIITGVLAVIGWGFLDRLHLAGMETTVASDHVRLDFVEKRLQALPIDAISRQEHVDLENKLTQQHVETLDAIRRLSEQVYNLARERKGY